MYLIACGSIDVGIEMLGSALSPSIGLIGGGT